MATPFRFAHTADVHFSETALLGDELVLDPSTGLNVRLHDVEQCAEAFAVAARAFGAELTIIAGDVYDRPRPSPNEERAAIGWVDRLAEHEPVVIIPGNHDYNGTPNEASAVTSLQGRRRVHVAEQPGYFDYDRSRKLLRWTALSEAAAGVDRAHDQPSDARIFVLPWPSRAALIADAENHGKTGPELNALVSDRLHQIVAALATLRRPIVPSILVFHGTIAGAEINHQPASLQADIGLTRADLAGFQYVALGHIHKRQGIALHGQEACPVAGVTPATCQAWYPGSLERNDFSEEFEDKGGNLVELAHDQAGTGWNATVTFAPTPARPYRTHSPAEVLERGIQGDDGRTVHRVKGEVTETERAEIRGRLAGAEVRHLSFALKVERPARLVMAPREHLTEEDMIRRELAQRGIPEAEAAEYLADHARIVLCAGGL